ncbi:nascent polypeptide-associated complex subunit alpha, muscle-specific form [Austrofundulus limnaeus]|uniref:Nascent polypeptide-associated complex subunit alpha, muscle-specific form n=1 Tax=Austrofundulus limnaeus TaxID=52670 RepID=A0A2I4CV32_AUSLI|nr:PREDICTED: nascent polypeptide-associated complex subunit alpha, muscle-specific form-like [Austrofundulus limnaeus]
MDQQEDSMDFKTVRAMFEEKEYLLRQHKARPVVPDKPKAISTPQSPSHLPPQSPSHLSPQSPSYLPSGARPSLLTSMTQALEAKALNAPRVVFKDEKDAKKPLIQTNVKGKEKSNGNGKEGKSKTGKERNKPDEKQEDSSDQKDKKLLSFLTKKEETAELVPAPPPPKVQKKKGFPVFRKSTKHDSAIIIDSLTLGESGPAPFIPVSSETDNIPEESVCSVPKSNPSAGLTPPSHTPTPPDLSTPPAILLEVPVLKAPARQKQPSPDTENPVLPDFNTIRQSDVILGPPSFVPSPPTAAAPIPPTIAAPTPPTIAAPIPPTIAAPTPPTAAAPTPPTTAAPTPPTAAAPTPPTIATPTPPTIAAPTPPTIAAPSRPSFAPPSPPKRVAPAGSASSNSAPPSHPNAAPQTPPSVAAPVTPNLVAPNLSATAVLDPVPSVSLTPLQKASPTSLLSDSPAQSPSVSPIPPARLTVSEASPPDLRVSGGYHAEDRLLTPDLDSTSKLERSISALTALERAEDMSTGKRTPPSDLRILNALEKARRKAASPLLNSNHYSITPPPEDHPLMERPSSPFLDLPPIDYEGEKPSSPKPAAVNGTDHRSAIRASLNQEGSDAAAELRLHPTPPPRQVQPEALSLYSSPVKPARAPSICLSQLDFIPPPPLFEEFAEDETADVPELEDLVSGANSPEVVAEWEHRNNKGVDAAAGLKPLEDRVSDPEYEDNVEEIPPPQTSLPAVHQAVQPTVQPDVQPVGQPDSLPVAKDPPPVDEPEGNSTALGCEDTENMYEDIATSVNKKKGKRNSDKKHKAAVKNPYVDSSQAAVQEKTKTGRFSKVEKKRKEDEKDEKEMKKKEKQRLEKERKEMKEKLEREKKEQKEREKKENEMKKTFKITGQEEVLYQAKVIVATKGRKHNLPCKSGDIVNIIRTDFCPKGKWLARDSSNNYGYIDVQHVELDIKEMLELGKKTARNTAVIDLKEVNAGSRASNIFQTETYTDDSEEWTCDEDETHSPAPDPAEPLISGAHSKTLSMPDMGDRGLPVNHRNSHSDVCDNSQTQARKEALQKLEIFLQTSKPENPSPSNPEPETSPVPEQEKDDCVPEESSEQEDFDPTAVILPPPVQYADFNV